MSLKLGSRDLAALLFTWQSRFVSTAQLRRAFWDDVSPRAASKRLILLREAGLLGFRAFPWLSERLLYFASRQGNQALVECGLLDRAWVGDHPRRPEELSPALRHDLSVVDLRLSLEESGADGRTWVSDHQLRTQNKGFGPQTRVPDGVFAYRFGRRAGPGLLEYEHATYRRPLVAGLLARLRDRYEAHQVFIVTRTPERAVTFRAWAEETGAYLDAPGQIAFSHHEAVAKDGLAGAFVDLQGRPWG